MQLSRHAADKLETYGIDRARLESWRVALESGNPFLDRRTGSLVLVIHSEAEVAERQHWQSHVIGQADREGQLLHGPL